MLSEVVLESPKIVKHEYPRVDFLVQKVCERVLGTWWYMHEMVVLVRF